MTTVLCFGDSNTHGSVPMHHRDDIRRFGPDERWPGVLRKELGAGFTVIEEGLPGRTTLRDDPIEGVYKNGLWYLRACLESHRPIDLMTLMLGTNDLKSRFAVHPSTSRNPSASCSRPSQNPAPLEQHGPRVLDGAAAARRSPSSATCSMADGRSPRARSACRPQAEKYGAAFLDAGRSSAPATPTACIRARRAR
jgi:lysophospholipase L1-like esterase